MPFTSGPSRAVALLVHLLVGGAAVPVHAADPATPAPKGAVDPRPAPAAPAPGTAEPEAGKAEAKRVVYLPETVKAQLLEELRQEVLAVAERDNWAAPTAVPVWVQRFRLSADVRFRYEQVLFGPENPVTGDFPDFNAINANKPFDMTGLDVANDRYLNVDEDRSRLRLRARLGADVKLGQGFSLQLRLASGEGTSPVSTNQPLGSPGGFSRYQVWVDRAAIRYAVGTTLVMEFGRFENPFFRTDLTWDEDVNLDGAALQAGASLGGGLRPFLVLGAFPVFTTAFSFPAERPDKFRSLDRWLYAAQVGATWQPAEAVTLRLGAAYYHFEGLQGRVSGPCDTHLKDVSCDTDHTRPSFAQKGNTYMTLRTPSAAALAAEAGGLVPRYQYFGLATQFEELVVTGRLEVGLGPALKVALDAEYAQNLAFSREQAGPRAVNNFGPCSPAAANYAECLASPPYVGGDHGYLGRITFGSATQAHRWDWTASLSYRYVETDAVVDAFDDSDFGAGGTNLEGYSVTAAVAVGEGVMLGARWYSADALVGPPLAVDVLHVDLSARF